MRVQPLSQGGWRPHGGRRRVSEGGEFGGVRLGGGSIATARGGGGSSLQGGEGGGGSGDEVHVLVDDAAATAAATARGARAEQQQAVSARDNALGANPQAPSDNTLGASTSPTLDATNHNSNNGSRPSEPPWRVRQTFLRLRATRSKTTHPPTKARARTHTFGDHSCATESSWANWLWWRWWGSLRSGWRWGRERLCGEKRRVLPGREGEQGNVNTRLAPCACLHHCFEGTVGCYLEPLMSIDSLFQQAICLRPVMQSKVSGFGFRVSGFGFRVSGFGFRVSGRGVWV
jgi:hypothetical protein